MRGSSMVKLVVLSIALLVLSTSAWADISGDVFRIDGNCALLGGCLGGVADATMSEVTGGIPIGSFTAPGIDFYTSGSGTLGNFLSSATSTTVGATELGQLMSNCPGLNGTQEGCYSTGIAIYGSGTFVNGTTYYLYHDDGATMFIDGIVPAVVNAPHPQEVGTPNSFVGTGITGGYQIYYVATNGNPERLQLDPSAVPEPGSILLLGFMGAVLGFGRKLRRS